MLARLIVFFWFFAALSVRGADPAAEKLAKEALDGFKKGRARLTSGVFRASGRLDYKRNRPPLDGPIVIFSAFDFDKGLLRFDRVEPVWEAPPADAKADGPLQLSRMGQKVVLAKDQVLRWRLNSDQATVVRRDERSAGGGVFDVRIIGLTNRGTMSAKGASWENAIKRFDNPLHDAVVEEKTLYRLSWFFLKHKVRWDVVFDAEKEFVPVRFEQRLGVEPEKPLPDPQETAVITWRQIEGVWLPATLRQEDSSGDKSDLRELTFHWESVNKKVKDRLFTWQGLELPRGTRVLDVRSGKPIELGVASGAGSF